MAPIETQGLTRRFRRKESVRQVNLTVPEGSVYALIGPNGAGKTTTIKLLMNLLRPSAGRATILGVDSTALGVPQFQRIGYVSESQHLPDWMTPDQLFDYCRGLYPSWDTELAAALRETLRLRREGRLRSLSRGTRMKAALLSALAFRPTLVVLDEPFTALDPLVRDELIAALQRPPGGRTWTVLLSSHDIHEVERVADWVGYLQDGRLEFSESVESLLARHRVGEAIPSLRDVVVQLVSRSSAP
jgi:ABC-2 type transport system ATP-binding protein